MSNYENAVGCYADDMSEEFYIKVKEILNPNLKDDFIQRMAISLADNFIQTGNCTFCEECNLTRTHAYCFLNDGTWEYQKEVEEAFDKDFQSSKEDSFDI